MGEATVPAEQPAAGQAARVSAPHVDAGRTGDHQGPSGQGPHPAVGLIWRITDRQTFGALRYAPRARRGLLTVAWLADAVPGAAVGDGGGAPRPPRVAFAIGHQVGTAVTRNRLRRRLRELARRAGLPGGAWLVVAAPGAGQATFPVLSAWWEEARRALERGVCGERG